MARYYNKNYIKKLLTDPLPQLPEDERIYFNVPYKEREFAQFSHCGFDSVRKLWFTGVHNTNLYALVNLYGVNDYTSEKAMALLKSQLKTLSTKTKEHSVNNNKSSLDKE